MGDQTAFEFCVWLFNPFEINCKQWTLMFKMGDQTAFEFCVWLFNPFEKNCSFI